MVGINHYVGFCCDLKGSWRRFYKGIGLLNLITTSAVLLKFFTRVVDFVTKPLLLNGIYCYYGSIFLKNEGVDFSRYFIMNVDTGEKNKINYFLALNMHSFERK